VYILLQNARAGLGVYWDDQGVAGSLASKCPYTGVNANREYKAISGCNAVPLEDEAAKAACSHWDEECLVDELMTGVLVRGSSPMLSRITIGSLQDLGFQVDYSKADSYTKANLGLGCTCARRRSLTEMSHGETLHLSGLRHGTSGNNGKVKRKISASAHQSAMEFGQALLAERAAVHDANRRTQEETASGAIYVGHKVVSVLVYDQDDVYGVVVHR
jgi:Leishmanolysin